MACTVKLDSGGSYTFTTKELQDHAEYLLARCPINEVKADAVIDAVCDFIGINRLNVYQKSRKKRFVIARKLIAYILSMHYNMWTTEIGKILRKDHSTITHYIKCIESDVRIYFETRSQYEKLCEKLELSNE